MTQILVPDIGDFHDVEVIDVLVKVGDTIAVDTPLVTLETDKATMDVPSTAAGVIKSLAVKKGDRVSKGSVVVLLEATAEAAAQPTTPASEDSCRSESATACSGSSREGCGDGRPATCASGRPGYRRFPRCGGH